MDSIPSIQYPRILFSNAVQRRYRRFHGFPLPNVRCIYSITNMENEWRYIGSTVHAVSRLNVHLVELAANRHHNCFLQRAWNEYGPTAFVAEIMEIVPSSEVLVDREQYHIDATAKCYNITPAIPSNAGRILSDGIRANRSELVCARVAKARSNYPYQVMTLAEVAVALETTVTTAHRMMGQGLFRADKSYGYIFIDAIHFESIREDLKDRLANANFTRMATARKGWKGGVSSDEWRRQASKRVRLRFSDPLEREKHGQKVAKALSNPETRAKISAANRERFANRDTSIPLPQVRFGENNHAAKLTEEKVRSIRLARASGKPIHDIAATYGVSDATVSHITNRRSWKHVA